MAVPEKLLTLQSPAKDDPSEVGVEVGVEMVSYGSSSAGLCGGAAGGSIG
jgi:hypothetical protein